MTAALWQLKHVAANGFAITIAVSNDCVLVIVCSRAPAVTSHLKALTVLSLATLSTLKSLAVFDLRTVHHEIM